MTKFLLDSGDPEEYKEIKVLAEKQRSELWGATTNPSLIAKKLTGVTADLGKGQKYTLSEAYDLQKKIALEIAAIVRGPVSAEVYADTSTKAEEMVEQGKEIATWHERVVVKLPTTLEGFKARTQLRKEGIVINNTLVFSQQQIFAICLHESLIQKTYAPAPKDWPPFISPFVGRLDDIGEDGMNLVELGMRIKAHTNPPIAIWMLASSIRSAVHIRRSILANSDIITAPGKAYREWFSLTKQQQDALDVILYTKQMNLKQIPFWSPSQELLSISGFDEFEQAIASNKLNIKHALTDKGLQRFADDWHAILK